MSDLGGLGCHFVDQMLHLVSPHTTYTSTHTPCKSHCPHVCLLQSGSFLSRHFGDPYRREARRARSSRADVWLSSMVEGRRLCHMLCFTTGYMPICKVRVSGVVRKRRFSPRLRLAPPPLNLISCLPTRAPRCAAHLLLGSGQEFKNRGVGGGCI